LIYQIGIVNPLLLYRAISTQTSDRQNEGQVAQVRDVVDESWHQELNEKSKSPPALPKFCYRQLIETTSKQGASPFNHPNPPARVTY
jgi:hypothetical protein